MKAIRVHEFGAPGVMRLEEVADLAAGAGEVVVQLSAVGVNPVETYIRSGKYARLPILPFTPGTDGAGTIHEVGEGVADFNVGDRVYLAGSLSGSYAEFALCNATQLHKLPAHISFAEGACVGVPYATAYRALHQRAAAKPGEVVLVHGATGGVGIACVQLAHAHACRVIGTGGSPKGRALAFAQGADEVLDHTQENYLDEVMRLSDGRGVDVILEMLANVNLARDLKILAPRGRVVIIGSRGQIEIDPRDVMSRDADVLGMSLWNATDDEMREIHENLVRGLENQTLRPIVGAEMDLGDAAEAHRQVLAGDSYGKIVLIP
jgi:NADPH2:quinone reductase